ncbi:MAG TPA: type II secretion system F family protein [Pirellulaceae bacterium]|nr:type II secretion system F family protein [Pirellulaceae bacterium]
MLLAMFNLASFLPFALFGAFGALAWLVLERIATPKARAEQRLEEFKDPSLRKRKDAEANSTSSMSKVLEAAAPSLAKPLQPKNEQEMGRLRLRLAHAGFRNESAVAIFSSICLISLIIGVVLGGGTLLLRGYSMNTLMSTIFFGGGMLFLPDIVLWFLTKKRKEAIFFGLPDCLDLMVVCVEAGLGLDQAMRKVAEEMKKSHPVIAEEFGLCNLQLQMGRGRSQVLQDLGNRTGVDDLRSLASILIQADKFGSSIAQALRVQSDSMRTRRRQIAEEKAAKTAVKLIFPLVLFIFPGIFVVLVGPAAITMIREMFPAMQGGQ